MNSPATRARYLALRRPFELFAIVLALPLLIPLCLLIALAVRLDSPGPALFRQRRVGAGGSTFIAFKFRTMWITHCGDGSRLTEAHDPRVTRLGRILRATHLDELPQIWNVLAGDMALIGPRPEPLVHVEWVEREIPAYRLRRAVRPGLTGWAQITLGYTTSLDEARQKLRLDCYYMRNASPLLDLRILARTIATVVTPHNTR